MSQSNTFQSKESLFQRHIKRKLINIFGSLTKEAMPIFTRGGDDISITPQIFGHYELRVKDLIDFHANNGYGDFLIDIGANIGLTTCQSGDLFKEVYCYEPNPLCFKILEVNTDIALKKCKVSLNNFGLGTEKSETTLFVPRGNWGGAFIHDQHNSYSDKELGEKDGYQGFDAEKYSQVPIRIEDGVTALKQVFESLKSRNLTNGFIKIDVEGYEPVIIQAIANALPENMNVVILFECFTKNFDPKLLLSHFGNKAEAFKLIRSPEKHIPQIKRVWQIITQCGYIYKVNKFDPLSNSTDIIFKVKT
jgi:FkbM family methyltransferase